MSRSPLRIGLIGYKFMGRAHSHAWSCVDRFFDLEAEPVLKVVCGRNTEAVSQFAREWGWQGSSDSWQAVVARDDVDLIDISTPGNTHAEIAITAAKAGKNVFCEKPLANSLAEAQQMLAAVRSSGVNHMVNFNYRRCPSITLAKQMIDAGEIGEIRHFRGTYLQDWLNDPELPMNWRLRKDFAGSGALGDLGAHAIDLARYLVGEISEVVGIQETFITQRPKGDDSTGFGTTADRCGEEVTVDDSSLFLAKFDLGAVGTFEATRVAPGRKNYNRFEINGSGGSLVWCLEDLNYLDYYSTSGPTTQRGFRRIITTEDKHPYAGNWWPPGHMLGYDHTFVNAVSDLVNDIALCRRCHPDFLEGARCVAVLEAVTRSVENKAWVTVEEVS